MCSNDVTYILDLEEQVKNLSKELVECQVCMNMNVFMCTRFSAVHVYGQNNRLLNGTR